MRLLFLEFRCLHRPRLPLLVRLESRLLVLVRLRLFLLSVVVTGLWDSCRRFDLLGGAMAWTGGPRSASALRSGLLLL